MFRTTLLVAALVTALPAFAGNENQNSCGNNGNNCGPNGGTATSYATVGNLTSSSAVKNSGNSTSVSVSEGGKQSVEINDVHPSEVKIKSVGFAPDVSGNTTANCRIAVSASAGWIAGAFGIGTSVLDAGCDTGRDIEILKGLGLRDAAILRACAKKELAAAMGAMCPVKESAIDKPGRS